MFLISSVALKSHAAGDAATKQLVKPYIPKVELVGATRISYMFWKLYDMRLYAEAGEWQEGKPFAIELNYLRAFKGVDIATRSIAEIRKQGFTDETKLSLWLNELSAIFPDVNKQDRLIGIAGPQGNAIFYFDEKFVGTIEDPAFSQWFFNIWLGENRLKPKLRKQLLNL